VAAFSESDDGRVGVIDIDRAGIRQGMDNDSVVIGGWIDRAPYSYLVQCGVGDYSFFPVIAIDLADDLG
jgi:hypothetical protein